MEPIWSRIEADLVRFGVDLESIWGLGMSGILKGQQQPRAAAAAAAAASSQRLVRASQDSILPPLGFLGLPGASWGFQGVPRGVLWVPKGSWGFLGGFLQVFERFYIRKHTQNPPKFYPN